MRIDSRKRILVVDDEPQILGFLGDLLGMAGWEVQSAGSGSEGVEKSEARIVTRFRSPKAPPTRPFSLV